MDFTIFTGTAQPETPAKKAWSFKAFIDNDGDLAVRAVDAITGENIVALFWVTKRGIEGDSCARSSLTNAGYDVDGMEFGEDGRISVEMI